MAIDDAEQCLNSNVHFIREFCRVGVQNNLIKCHGGWIKDIVYVIVWEITRGLVGLHRVTFVFEPVCRIHLSDLKT